MTKRKQITPKNRFEIFKRDKFQCQYCGQRAPDVVLHVDHIISVAEGGDNDPLNLRTACAKCNQGKGARLLTDEATVEAQSKELAELEERRQQIDMLVAWREELKDFDEYVVDRIEDHIVGVGRYGLNENGRANVKRWLKRNTEVEIIEAIDRSFLRNLVYVDDLPTDESWNKAFNQVPAVIRFMRAEKENPNLSELYYIQGILRNRFKHKWGDYMPVLNQMDRDGCDIEAMKEAAKSANDLDGFCSLMGYTDA